MTFLLEIVGVIVRAGAASLCGVLIQHGWLTQGQGDKLAEGLIGLAIVLLWSAYQKYGSRVKFLMAAGSAKPVTEEDIKEAIKKGSTVSVMTPQDVTPKITVGGGR